MEDKYECLLVKPGEKPEKVTIGTELEDLQAAVGGYIEVLYPFADPVGIICNEEGKLEGLPLNRALRDENGEIYDVVAGDMLVIGLTDDSFESLSPEMMDKYEKELHQPECFVKMGKGIIAIPINDDALDPKVDKASREIEKSAAKKMSAPVI